MLLKILNNPCVSVNVVNFALSIMYSICVWCSILMATDTVVDKKGHFAILNDYVKHTNEQLNKNKEQENVLNVFGCI